MSNRKDLVERMLDENEVIRPKSMEELLETVDVEEELTFVIDSYDDQEESAEEIVRDTIGEDTDDFYPFRVYTCPDCERKIVHESDDPLVRDSRYCAECRTEMKEVQFEGW
ncbi:hypothetical protein [Halorubrum distributum]|uniref:hypothetical protein n=1 Tax=Halorubrum distributum TaxID=29283 RepID=UPI0012687552|nr:hypothetical protein [Halorubrum arcis]